MSIANEIQRIQSAKADIKAAIENKGVTVGDGTIDTYAEKISQILGGGSVDSHYDTFWDNFQNNGARTVYRYAFSYDWNDNIFNPKYDIKPTDANYMFYTCAITSLANCDKIDLSNCTEMEYFARYSQVKDFPPLDISKAKNLNHSFRDAYGLENLTLNNVQTTCAFTNTFLNASKLKELRVTGTIGKDISFASSPLLSDTSIENIIDCLADLTGVAGQTLTLNEDVGAKLTEEQKTNITAKNWVLVY